MSNFRFLEAEWPQIAVDAQASEKYTATDPRGACFYARRALELAVQWLYEHDPNYVRSDYDYNLNDLMKTPSFLQHTPKHIINGMNLIRRQGNKAVHENREIATNKALTTVTDLYHILFWLARTYTTGDPQQLPNNFNESLIPPPPERVVRYTVKKLQQIEADLQQRDEALLRERENNQHLQAQLAQIQAEVEARKQANVRIPVQHNYSEAETRERLINELLREAGWDPHAPNVAEYPVRGMPSNSGDGKADYVLWGDDGLPLAVIEAKRAGVEPQRGQEQARLYADCLEQQFGRRPIIFNTNGAETWLWDDQQHPPRLVQGFYTKAALERLIQRREANNPALHKVAIDQEIVNRPYQHEALRRMSEHLSAGHRRGLIVMATGTGKTRVSIALIDLLMRAGWVKRILFLADRSTLVHQTTNAFKRFLAHANPVNITDTKARQELLTSDVVVSTYHTMLNLIDQRNERGEQILNIGHFDLIIIDEAHRSVYQTFGEIFNYFDSLLIGLTATPKDEVDRNTYQLFNLPNQEPTFAYDLDQAVKDGYLVPYKVYEVPTKFMRQGIRYDELSPAEQLEWELIDWNSEGDAMPEAIDAQALNKWLFNADTVDIILKTLMEHGLKVAGGDRIGKTIIFAKNHAHAQFIQQRYNANYPQQAGHSARVIDSHINYVQALIDHFSKPANQPDIAISVDMLDTGVDIPEVVNLVFFKIVRSKTKFFQMIGRGTRLRPDLFGPGDDKAYFLIFDTCGNFEFFNQNPEGMKSKPSESLSQRIFKQRLELLQRTREEAAQQPELQPLAESLADELHGYVAGMNLDNFLVRRQRTWVESFSERERWNELHRNEINNLREHVSGLPSAVQTRDNDEAARRFDRLILEMQLALLDGASHLQSLQTIVSTIAADLASKTTIPDVAAASKTLQALQKPSYWEALDLLKLEHLRLELRSIVRHVDRSTQRVVYTSFTDRAGEIRETQSIYSHAGVNRAAYERSIKQFILDNAEQPAIHKLHSGEPLTSGDLEALKRFFYQSEALGSSEQWQAIYGEPDNFNLPRFIRSIIGLDRRAAKAHFATFLNQHTFSAKQLTFIEHMIDHLSASGTIQREMLYQSPFIDIDFRSIDAIFSEEQSQQLWSLIDQTNQLVQGV